MEKPTQEPNEELEYNDGLGDLLREKEQLEFSWPKTTLVIVIVLTVIFLGATALFKYGKTTLTKSPELTPVNMAVASVEPEKVPSKKNIKNNTDTLALIPVETKPKTTKNKVNILDIYTPKQQKVTQKTTQKTVQKVTSKKHPFKVIVGSFSKKKFAVALTQKLTQKGLTSFVWKSSSNKGILYRVQTGAFMTREKAISHQKRLTKNGFESFIMVQK